MTQNAVVATGAPEPPSGIHPIPREITIVTLEGERPALLARRAATPEDSPAERLYYVRISENCIVESTLENLRNEVTTLASIVRTLEKENRPGPARTGPAGEGRDL